MADPLPPGANPYVGPRTFTRADGERFFGREREARELFSLVISQRLVLFYAQSGAGKSSLLNTRLAPMLEASGFAVLPVARVGGELPPGVAAVDNIYLFNLMVGLDQAGRDPGRLAQVRLADFLARLTSDDGEHYYYDETLQPSTSADAEVSPAPGLAAAGEDYAEPNYVLIVDQFEELFTTHPARWQERAEFFAQLDEAMRSDRRLWVVLTLREDYVAALDPYAPLLTDKLRARYYMQRMEIDAGLDAIRKPAELGGRPFAAGVAEKLTDDLCQVRVPGQDATVAGQYVEPVQLQVVCYQLWERLQVAGGKLQVPGGRLQVAGGKLQVAGEAEDLLSATTPVADLQPSDVPPATLQSATLQSATLPLATPLITATDLAAAGDVNQALEQFYTDTLASVLAEPVVQAAGVTERALREWFDRELITETGIRNTVFRNEKTGKTGTLANVAVDALSRRFLLHTELRSGGAWVELVHDRFVEPIRANNSAWFPLHLSALQRQAALWDEQGRSSGLLLRDAALAEAEAWAAAHADELAFHEQDFLAACRESQKAAERERRQSRRIRMLAVAAVAISILAIGTAIFAWTKTQQAKESAKLAQDRIAQVGKAVGDLGIERLLSMASQLDEAGDTSGATTLLQTAVNLNPALLTGLNVNTLNADSSRLLSSIFRYDENGGEYVFIPAGAFTMGSNDADTLAYDNEKPSNPIDLPGYWIGRTEVTNEQYGRCVATNVCEPLSSDEWNKPEFAKRPVTGVDWRQAIKYAEWVGGRLPTEAEWEKACRSADGRIYPWGNEAPSNSRLNYNVKPDIGLNSNFKEGDKTDVGSYPAGANGLYDMAGNVSEWTSSQYKDYPYDATDGRENLIDYEARRVLRGGYFGSEASYVRCAVRGGQFPEDRNVGVGFRVGFAPPSPSGP